ncbi:MAG: hypothetical protein ACLTZB_02500 [Streptococcus salivarius]
MTTWIGFDKTDESHYLTELARAASTIFSYIAAVFAKYTGTEFTVNAIRLTVKH